MRVLLYRDRLRQRVYFPECGDSLASRSFTAHRQRQYGFGRGGANPPPPEGGQGGEGEDIVREGIPAQYRVSFPDILSLLRCPVEGYQGTASSRTNLRAHFSHQHPWGSIVILEEVNQPTPGAPSLTCFSHRRHSIGRTRHQRCVGAGWRGSYGGWLLWRQRNGWGGSSWSMGHR